MGRKGVNTAEVREASLAASSELSSRANAYLSNACQEGSAIIGAPKFVVDRWRHDFSEVETPDGANITRAEDSLTVEGNWETDAGGVYSITVLFPEDTRELPTVFTEKDGRTKTPPNKDYPRLLGQVASLIPEV